jgi:hypothetical protein
MSGQNWPGEPARAARSSLLPHLHRAMLLPTEQRFQGRKVPACRPPDMCAAIDLTLMRQVVGSPRWGEAEKIAP